MATPPEMHAFISCRINLCSIGMQRCLVFLLAANPPHSPPIAPRSAYEEGVPVLQCLLPAAAYARRSDLAPAYVSIGQHMSSYVSIRQPTSAYLSIPQHTSAYLLPQARRRQLVLMRPPRHDSERKSFYPLALLRLHTSAYVSILQHT